MTYGKNGWVRDKHLMGKKRNGVDASLSSFSACLRSSSRVLRSDVSASGDVGASGDAHFEREAAAAGAGEASASGDATAGGSVARPPLAARGRDVVGWGAGAISAARSDETASGQVAAVVAASLRVGARAAAVDWARLFFVRRPKAEVRLRGIGSWEWCGGKPKQRAFSLMNLIK